MHSLGHDFIPPSIHSGGLRYHGMAPLVSHVVHTGLVEATSHGQVECFAEAVRFARLEGIIPAPEPSHAIRQVVVEVERPIYARVRGKDRAGAQVLIEASGHEARVLQHEIDHLHGVLMFDRMTPDQRKAAMAEYRKLQETTAAKPQRRRLRLL